MPGFSGYNPFLQQLSRGSPDSAMELADAARRARQYQGQVGQQLPARARPSTQSPALGGLAQLLRGRQQAPADMLQPRGMPFGGGAGYGYGSPFGMGANYGMPADMMQPRGMSFGGQGQMGGSDQLLRLILANYLQR